MPRKKVHNRKIPDACLLLLLVLGSLTWGCTNRYPKTVKIKGQVSYQGEPLKSGLVTFSPVEQGTRRVAYAYITEGGFFQLTSFRSRDGIQPGEYRIAVQAYDRNKPTARYQRGTPVIPEKYLTAETSGLTATVAEGGSQTLNFNLE